MQVTNCIPDDVLLSLSSGELSDAAAAEWEAHLLICHDCLQRVRAVKSTDPISSALGEVKQLPVSPVDPPIVDELMQRLSDRKELESLSRTAISMAPECATQRLDSEAIRASSASHAVALVSSAQLSPGTQLGPYRIVAKLGEGGMGAVYQATHTKLDKVVALKILSLDATRHPDAVARFEREMRAIGKLEHPHIVRAMDAGELQGVHFLSMEFVDGTDLQRCIKEQGPLTIQQACVFLRQAAEALAAAHRAGLVHRDIKPSNLLLGKTGNIKLLDLGLALLADDTQASSDLTTAGQSFGTPDYMAPEQWEDAHAADARSDLYALGCTLFYLLVGRAPFGSEHCRTAVAKMKAHVTEPPPSLRAARVDVPAELEMIYRRLMEKRPQDRFRSADELVQALQAFLQRLPAQASDPTATERELSTSSEASLTVRAPVASAVIERRGGVGWKGGTLAGAGALLLLGAIVITIFNRDGTQTVLTFPEGVKAEIKAEPDREVRAAQGDFASLATLEQPATPTAAATVASATTTAVARSIAPKSEPPAFAVAPFTKTQAQSHQEAWARHFGVPVTFTNRLGMTFRLIPPGEFVMGGTPEEVAEGLASAGSDVAWVDRVQSEAPQHRVKLIRPFYLGVYEVTQGDYLAVMGRNPSEFSATGDRRDDVANIETSRFPVERVSWFDAIDFCNKLSERELLSPTYRRGGDNVQSLPGSGYALPSEAEWEFACRAGTTTRYWCGNDLQEVFRIALFRGNSDKKPQKVGRPAPNPFGLHDMHGGVWEWVQDEWIKDKYQLDADKMVIAPLHWNANGRRKVVRGGSFDDAPLLGRSAQRYWREPSFVRSFLGFRVSMSLEAVRSTLLAQKVKTGSSEVMSTAKPAVAPFDASQARAAQEAWAEHRHIPVEFVNSLGMKFHLIPPGRFTMGSPADEIAASIARVDLKSLDAQAWIDHLRDEAPQHEVELTEPYYAGIYEVTQSEYEKIMLANPSSFSAAGKDREFVSAIDTRYFPVENVSWNDAIEFCDRLSLQEQRLPVYQKEKIENQSEARGVNGYRLLTEAEWEFACRAGTTTTYWFGPDGAELPRSDWCNIYPNQSPHAVGTLLANPFGLFDLHGNVTEWCHDGFEAATFSRRQGVPVVNPVTPFEQTKERLFRGGSFHWSETLCRSGHRHVGHMTHKGRHIGFRIMLPAADVTPESPRAVP